MEPNTPHPSMPSAEYVAQELAAATSANDFFGKDGIFAKLFSKTIEQMLEAEMENHLGYKKYDPKGIGSGNSRNGSYSRKLKTSAGEVDLSVPRDRAGDFSPEAIGRFETRTHEFEDKIIAMYGYGTTTADIAAFVYETYGFEISKEQVSKITDRVLPLVDEWRNRSLETVYPIIYLDCIHVKLRRETQVKPVPIYVALALGLDGKKDILGHWVGDGAEGSKFWLSVVANLQARGVQDILIACVDGLNGFEEAICSVFPQTVVQACVIHQVRNSLRYVNHKDERPFARDLRSIYQAPTREEAYQNLQLAKVTWEKSYRSAFRGWDENWSKLTAYFDYPEEVRRIIYTTNAIEGYNRMLRKVTSSKAIFPTEESVYKMFYLATQNVAKKWTNSIPEWGKILCQLDIMFEGRMPLK